MTTFFELAIASALKRRTLYLAHGWSEWRNEPYATIEDEHGLIEKHMTMKDAQDRVKQIAKSLIS